MTGMRVSESNCLKFGSLIEENSWVGAKTRLFKNAPEGGSIEIWAAGPYIKKIFIKIRPIAEKFFGVSGRELDEIYLKSDPRKYRSSKVVKHMKTQRKVDSHLNWSDVNDITLDEKDVHEFWVLNPNISNRVIVEKVIYVGGKWSIRSHQYRRSIAVHLNRLELVSTRYLVVQFKHMYKTVTDWYCSGTPANSKSLGNLARAFISELDKAGLERSASLAIAFQESEQLFGGGGQALMKQKNLAPNKKLYHYRLYLWLKEGVRELCRLEMACIV